MNQSKSFSLYNSIISGICCSYGKLTQIPSFHILYHKLKAIQQYTVAYKNGFLNVFVSDFSR
jgi:hypothetical protein